MSITALQLYLCNSDKIVSKTERRERDKLSVYIICCYLSLFLSYKRQTDFEIDINDRTNYLDCRKESSGNFG